MHFTERVQYRSPAHVILRNIVPFVFLYDTQFKKFHVTPLSLSYILLNK